MKRWFRSTLRRCGIDLPFTDVVCPHHVKTIRIVEGTRVEVIDRRSLVFLAPPEPGELRDLVAVTTPMEADSYVSPDSVELRRSSTPAGTQVCWMPRDPIVPYALHTHQYGWMGWRQPADAVLYSEFRCTTRTGIVELEIVTPGRFEAGVAFKRPRWRRLNTEHNLVKYALKQLGAEGEPPSIAEDGSRATWKLVGPKPGDRYVYVGFEENGVKMWRKRVEEKSIVARMRRLITSPLASS